MKGRSRILRRGLRLGGRRAARHVTQKHNLGATLNSSLLEDCFASIESRYNCLSIRPKLWKKYLKVANWPCEVGSLAQSYDKVQYKTRYYQNSSIKKMGVVSKLWLI